MNKKIPQNNQEKEVEEVKLEKNKNNQTVLNFGHEKIVIKGDQNNQQQRPTTPPRSKLSQYPQGYGSKNNSPKQEQQQNYQNKEQGKNSQPSMTKTELYDQFNNFK